MFFLISDFLLMTFVMIPDCDNIVISLSINLQR